ncbi:hypothetical protein KCU72_g86, partial [Aureobasidium melanogenum]
MRHQITSKQLVVSVGYLLTSTTVPKRVRISADVSQKSVLQSHFDTLKGRRSIRVADASRPKSHLLRLAKEIRAMIFEYLFAMMAEGETFKGAFD